MIRPLSALFALILTTFITPRSPGPNYVPGTVHIGDHLFMRACEVSVHEYMEFIAGNNYDPSLFPDDNALPNRAYQALFKYLRGSDHSDRRRKVVYDSISRTYGGLPLVYPIAGITYEQALRYCQWLEETTNSKCRPGRQVHITLPSIDLYRRLIPAIDSFNKKHDFPLYNYKGASDYPKMKPHARTITQRVDAFRPTAEGLYNLLGNVAEMTATKGIAMGGSFRHYAFECCRDNQQTYSKPEDWLGFRYIVTPNKKAFRSAEAASQPEP